MVLKQLTYFEMQKQIDIKIHAIKLMADFPRKAIEQKLIESDLNALITYFIASEQTILKIETIYTLHKWVSNGFRMVNLKNFSIILNEQSKTLNDPEINQIIHMIYTNIIQ